MRSTNNLMKGLLTMIEYDDECDERYEAKMERNFDKELEEKMDRGYFVRNDNRMIFYEDISIAIRTLHPELVGKHIFEQLKVLGLYEDFMTGSTPCSLPYTFSGSEKW